jgi:hypothetical protein
MYPSSGSTIRGDLNTFVQEASAADKFFIGPLIMPPFEVDLRSGQYPVLKKGNGSLLKAGSTTRAPKGSYGEIDRSWDNDTYDTVDRGLEELIDDTQEMDMSRFFNQETVTANLVRRCVQLDHETRVAAATFNTTNFGAATNSTVAYTYENLATIDGPTDILAAIERVNDNAEEANTLVMSPNVFNRLKLSTKMQNFIRGNRPSDATLNITQGMMQQAFAEQGITNVYVGRARYDSAKKGQAFSSARVWSDTYIWVGSIGGGDFMTGGMGRTIVWNKEGGLFVTEAYRDEKRRSGVIRVRQNTTEKVINAGCGTLIATQYS